jgi:hypothetical protein
MSALRPVAEEVAWQHAVRPPSQGQVFEQVNRFVVALAVG